MMISVIGGLGHVGLPLSLQLASVGLGVEIVDTDKNAIELFKYGKAKFVEDGIENAIRELAPLIRISDEPTNDIIIVATNRDDIDRVISGLEDRFILVRQTVRPGTIRRLRERFRVNYVPERLAQGEAMKEILIMPQIVGCEDDSEYEVIEEIFSWTKCIRLSYEEAELAKLLCNYYRYGTFALANDMYVMSLKFNADFNKIRDAVMEDYPRMSGFPKAGFAGGFCLPKDTLYLEPFSPLLARTIFEVNTSQFVRAVVRHILSFNPSSVGILGVTSKSDIDDTRGSVVLHYMIPYLKSAKSDTEVRYFDPFVDSDSLADVLSCDVVIIGTPHNFIKQLDLSGKIVVDPWGIVKEVRK